MMLRNFDKKLERTKDDRSGKDRKNCDYISRWKKYSIGPSILPKSHLINDHNNKMKDKKYFLAPVPLFAEKDLGGLFFRTFYFVDRYELDKINEFLEKNKKLIIDFLKRIDEEKKVSQFQIFNIYPDKNCKMQPQTEFINFLDLSSIGRYNEKSYLDTVFEEIGRKSPFKFSRNIDVSKFYDSIYIHSIEWTELDEQLREPLNDLFMNINGRITKGIPTGPTVSKIFSEIILTQVMLDLKKEIKDENVHVYRFADDFRIYFNEEIVFLRIAKKLALVLNKYKLSINKEKLDNNYEYEGGFKTIESSYDLNEDEWNVKIGIIELCEKQKNKIEVLYTSFLKEISSIKNTKEKIAFYKFVLKTWMSKTNFSKIKINSKLINLFYNFCINYIVISDSNLNIPSMFLNKILNFSKSPNLIDNPFGKLSNIYETTNSEMKKIFIFDLLFKHKKGNELKPFIFDLLFKHKKGDEKEKKAKTLKKLVANEQFLHISQLLEAGIITFEEVQNSTSYKWIKVRKNRLEPEWVVWLYATSIDSKMIKSAYSKKIKSAQDRNSKIIESAQDIIKNKSFFKPFKYNIEKI